MPNRFIKESICKSETLDLLTAEEERLFYRLIVNCDDFGRFDAKPAIVKNQCFRLDEGKLKVDTVEKWLTRLCQVGLIILYENQSKRYLQFLTWHEHQQQRANNSKYPDPESEESALISFDINCNQLKPVPANLDRPRISNTNTNTNKGGVGEKENIPPTLDEVKTYCKERNNKVNPQQWHDHYTSNGWMVGKTKMKDWKAAVRTWEHENKSHSKQAPQAGNFEQRPIPDDLDKFCKDPCKED
jgi:hypothetical protein